MSNGKRHTPEEIESIVRQHEAGLAASAVCTEYDISPRTLSRWKSKYGGMGPPDTKRLEQLEKENRRLKRVVAEQASDLEVVKSILDGPGG